MLKKGQLELGFPEPKIDINNLWNVKDFNSKVSLRNFVAFVLICLIQTFFGEGKGSVCYLLGKE